MNSYTKSYNFGYLSADDRLKGNDSIVIIFMVIEVMMFCKRTTKNN